MKEKIGSINMDEDNFEKAKRKENQQIKEIATYVKNKGYNYRKRGLKFTTGINATINVTPKENKEQKEIFKQKQEKAKKQGKRFKPTKEDYEMTLLLEDIVPSRRKELIHNLDRQSLINMVDELCHVIYSYKWVVKQVKKGQEHLNNLEKKPVIVVDDYDNVMHKKQIKQLDNIKGN